MAGRTAVSGSRASFASGARILSIGIASTGIFTFAYLATASHVLDAASLQPDLAVLGDHVRDPVGDLPADRAAALAHDRRPPRPRGCTATRCASPPPIQFGFALVFLVVALALRHEIQQGMFDGSATLYWILVVGVLAYAGQLLRPRLAGRPRSASPSTAGLVFLESTSRFLFPLAVAVGIGSGQGAVGLGMAVAPFASLSVMPLAFRRIRERAPAERAVGAEDVVGRRRRRRRRGTGAGPARGGGHAT